MLSGKIVKEFELERQRFTFRYPKFEDYKQLQKLFNGLVEEGAMIGINRKYSLKEELEQTTRILQKVENKEIVYLVVESVCKLLGQANITKKSHTKSHIGELSISLRKEIRSMGIGKMLMEAVISEAKKNLKIEIIELEGFSQNEAALGLYKKFGFKVAGKVKKGFKRNGRYFDRVLMVKYL